MVELLVRGFGGWSRLVDGAVRCAGRLVRVNVFGHRLVLCVDRSVGLVGRRVELWGRRVGLVVRRVGFGARCVGLVGGM